MIDDDRWRSVAALFCSAALLGVAGCGGGGAAPAPAPVAAAPAVIPSAPDSGAASASASAAAPLPGAAPMLADCEMFPANAIFNTRIDDVSRFPAHAKSARLGRPGRRATCLSRTDWGVNDNPADSGVVLGHADQRRGRHVRHHRLARGVVRLLPLGREHRASATRQERMRGGRRQRRLRHPARLRAPCRPDQRRFPFPLASRVLNEDGNCNDPNSCGDRHVLVVEKGACRLWESFFALQLSGQWYAMTTAAWDLKSLALRPAEWASRRRRRPADHAVARQGGGGILR